jgi:hypothetical protein
MRLAFASSDALVAGTIPSLQAYTRSGCTAAPPVFAAFIPLAGTPATGSAVRVGARVCAFS